MKNFIFKRFGRYPYLLRLLVVISSILLTFGAVIHWVEPEQFPSVFDGVWWAIITTSTIGYGDYVPVTIAGRMIGILLVLAGVGFVSTYFVTLATKTLKQQNGIKKGTVSVYVKDHIIVIGWNERSREIIYNYVQVQKDRPIILIDSSLEESPFTNEGDIHFIKGVPFSDEVLKKANVKEANMVILTSDATKSEVDADMQTILNIVAIKGFVPNVYCVAEILTGEQIVNAKRAGADEIIPSNKLTSSIMLQTMITHGVSDALLDFVSLLKGVRIEFQSEHNFGGLTFESASTALLKENQILLGIFKEGNTMINPPNDYRIDMTDQLLVIRH